MTAGERIKYLRKDVLKLTLEQFGERVGVKKSALSYLENGKSNLTDQMALSICREFNINEAWLRDGVGEMKKQTDDIFSEAVADMLMEDNPFYDLIKNIVETYAELDPRSQEVIVQACDKLIENLHKKREGEAPPQT